MREAQAAAVLDHPNICTVYEIDYIEGQTFIAMAYIKGQNLRKKIESGPLKLEEALDITIQVAEALQVAHEKGIIHRDIKSANIMVMGKGQAKILDFGLAKLAGEENLTRMERFDEAIAEVRRAQEMDPLSLIMNATVGLIFYFTRRNDEAIEQYPKTIEIDPNF